MTRLRVVNLGLPKSGTTTIGEALSASGLRVADHKVRAGQSQHKDLAGRFVGRVMYDSYFKTGDPLARFDEFDGFAEISSLHGGNTAYPQMDAALIEAIARHHPGVRFVASWRDPQALSNSMLKWNNLVPRLIRNGIPGLPIGYGGEEHERIMWIEGHYNFLDTLFGGDPMYLRIDVADDAAPRALGAHIGREIKWWGAANQNLKARAADGLSAE